MPGRSRRTRTFPTAAQPFCPCPRSALRGDGARSRSRALPGPIPPPQRHLAGPRGRPCPSPKSGGALFLKAPKNSARLPHKSPYYSSGVGSKSGEDAARRSPRRRALGAGRCPGLRAAGAGRRKRSRGGGGGGSFPFPQPWLRGRMLTVPAAWTIFVRTTRETEKERIWGGKERRVPS